MAELKYEPVPPDHKVFLAKARARKGFTEAYDALALEDEVAGEMRVAFAEGLNCAIRGALASLRLGTNPETS